jgi:hypothetical protein
MEPSEFRNWIEVLKSISCYTNDIDSNISSNYKALALLSSVSNMKNSSFQQQIIKTHVKFLEVVSVILHDSLSFEVLNYATCELDTCSQKYLQLRNSYFDMDANSIDILLIYASKCAAIGSVIRKHVNLEDNHMARYRL